MGNYQRKKLWQWTSVIAVFFALIIGSVLIYHWWQAKQTDTKLKNLIQQLDQAKQKQEKELKKANEQHQLQQKQLPQVREISQNSAIQEFFNDLLQGYAVRFAEKQKLTDYCLPLSFGGFYQKPILTGVNQGEMGNCEFKPTSQQVTIRLNQLYLLNKLGHDRYFATPECYLVIDFAALTGTLAHELAHYFQFAKHGQSSCESSGIKDANNNLLAPELVKEHTEFTQEIKAMIINSREYSALEKLWKEIK